MSKHWKDITLDKVTQITRYMPLNYDMTTPGTVSSSHQAMRQINTDLKVERFLDTLDRIHWKPIPFPRQWLRRPKAQKGR